MPPDNRVAQIELLLKSLAAPNASDVRGACAAARSLQHLSAEQPAALYPWRKQLFHHALRTPELRVRMNLILILGRLPLKGRDRAAVIDWMFERLADESSLARTFALQALIDLSEADPALRARVLPFVLRASEQGTAAMQARARKLLRRAGLENK